MSSAFSKDSGNLLRALHGIGYLSWMAQKPNCFIEKCFENGVENKRSETEKGGKKTTEKTKETSVGNAGKEIVS